MNRVLDEVHLTDTEVSKLFDVVIAELKAGRVGYPDLLNFEQPFNQVVFIIKSGERYPAHYVYKLNKKKGILSMYCYYLQDSTEVGYACNGDERFSYYWNLLVGDAEDGGYIKRPSNPKIVDIMEDTDVQRDFMYTFFIVNWFIKHAGEETSIVDSSSEKVSVVEAVRDGKRGSGGVRYKNVVYVRKVYSFDRVSRMNKSEIRRVFRCLCWGVRGHFRKHVVVDEETGKQVVKQIFVRPYLKGKKRDDVSYYTGKEYKL